MQTFWKSLAAAGLVTLTAQFASAQTTQVAAQSDEFADAAYILNALNGTVKRWEHPPIVTIVQDRPLDRGAVEATLGVIRDQTGLAIAEPRYLDVGIDGITAPFYSDSRFELSRDEEGRLFGALQIADSIAIDAPSHLFVFHVSPAMAAHFMILTSRGGGSLSLEREYLQGGNPCYYVTKSNAQGMAYGVVFIAPRVSIEFQQDCIYEEIMQTMGLVNDAEGSPYFTFDNTSEPRPRDRDALLLQALYDPRITTGSPVEEVVEIYRQLLPQ